jgi:hypothetical protein
MRLHSQHCAEPAKTYNSRYSLVVTHPTTNLPIWSLYMGERTGSLVFTSLWSYVTDAVLEMYMEELIFDYLSEVYTGASSEDENWHYVARALEQQKGLQSSISLFSKTT